MTNDTETITGEVVDALTVGPEMEAVQWTHINLVGESETEMHLTPGEYRLVRVSDDE